MYEYAGGFNPCVTESTGQWKPSWSLAFQPGTLGLQGKELTTTEGTSLFRVQEKKMWKRKYFPAFSGANFMFAMFGRHQHINSYIGTGFSLELEIHLGVGCGIWTFVAKLREASALPRGCWHKPQHPQSFRRHGGMLDLVKIAENGQWNSQKFTFIAFFFYL